jgi:hypothetical protein
MGRKWLIFVSTMIAEPILIMLVQELNASVITRDMRFVRHVKNSTSELTVHLARDSTMAATLVDVGKMERSLSAQ